MTSHQDQGGTLTPGFSALAMFPPFARSGGSVVFANLGTTNLQLQLPDA